MRRAARIDANKNDDAALTLERDFWLSIDPAEVDKMRPVEIANKLENLLIHYRSIFGVKSGADY